MVGKIGYQLFIDKKIPEERFVVLSFLKAE
jgi:hypothetical protein